MPFTDAAKQWMLDSTDATGAAGFGYSIAGDPNVTPYVTLLDATSVIVRETVSYDAADTTGTARLDVTSNVDLTVPSSSDVNKIRLENASGVESEYSTIVEYDITEVSFPSGGTFRVYGGGSTYISLGDA